MSPGYFTYNIPYNESFPKFFLNKCGVFEEIKYVKGKSDKRHLKKTYFILDIFRNDTHTFLFQTQCACHTNQISSILAYHDFQLDSECNRLK